MGPKTTGGVRSIPRPFTPEALLEVLRWGLTPDAAAFDHQDIAHWCWKYAAAARRGDRVPGSGAAQVAYRVAEDVDAQWELYLVNTYAPEELGQLELSRVRLPIEWFSEWVARLEAVTDAAGG